MLDLPALFGPKRRVMGLIGMVWVGPKALKLPSLMDVNIWRVSLGLGFVAAQESCGAP